MKKIKNYKSKVASFMSKNSHLTNKNRYTIMERLLFNDGLVDYKDGKAVFLGETGDVLRAVVTYDRCIRNYFKNITEQEIKKELSEPYRKEFRRTVNPRIYDMNASASM